MEFADRRFRPYVFGLGAEQYAQQGGLKGALCLDPLDPGASAFSTLVNSGNRLAFGDLAMPRWVQLDCCTLPSAMIGFAAPREDLDEPLWSQLGAPVSEYSGWVPVSEYCGIARMHDEGILGISLYSLLPGLGLGVRTKAAALACYASRVQLGVTQYDNPALRVHTAFGPLQIVRPAVHGHERGATSFLYRLEVPKVGLLWHLISEGFHPPEPAEDAVRLEITVRIADDVAAELAKRPSLAVVAPGLHIEGDRRYLILG